VSFINVVYDVTIYMLIMSQNGMASVKLIARFKVVFQIWKIGLIIVLEGKA
jgi:hypothetical protein